MLDIVEWFHAILHLNLNSFCVASAFDEKVFWNWEFIIMGFFIENFHQFKGRNAVIIRCWCLMQVPKRFMQFLVPCLYSTYFQYARPNSGCVSCFSCFHLTSSSWIPRFLFSFVPPIPFSNEFF